MSTTSFEERLAEALGRIDEAAERLALPQARIDLAADSPAASDLEGELRTWDIELERLQTIIATETWEAREQAEEAIRDLRSRRITVGERLARSEASCGANRSGRRRR